MEFSSLAKTRQTVLEEREEQRHDAPNEQSNQHTLLHFLARQLVGMGGALGAFLNEPTRLRR